MAQDPTTIELKDGRTATIRSFVRNKDRRKVLRAALASQELSEDSVSSNGDVQFTLKGSDAIDYVDAQVEALLLEYNGNTRTPYKELEDSEHEDDYTTISEAVQKIFEASGDPKGKKAGA